MSPMTTPGRTRTITVLYRVAAVMFALAGIVTALNAYLAYERSRSPGMYIGQSITAFSFCAVVVALSRGTAKKIQLRNDTNLRNP